MAQTTKNDELNIIDFFSEMDLPQSEIDKRIALAQAIKEMYHRFFLMLRAENAINELDSDTFDYVFFEDYLRRGYVDILENQGYKADDYIDQYLDKVVIGIIKVSVKNINLKYYISKAREIAIAENDANVILNHNLYVQKVALGYTRKRWRTMNDNDVRDTHMLAEGQERDIDKPFDIGTSQLMFPCDTSLGADANEIIQCRCTCDYLR